MHNSDASETWGSAIRIGDYKLIMHQSEQAWFPVPGSYWEGQNRSAEATGSNDECTGGGRNQKCNYLFNIATDPDETVNLIASEPEVTVLMKSRLAAISAKEAECATCGTADPDGYTEAAKTGFWTPWLGEKPPAADQTGTEIDNTPASASGRPDGGDLVAIVSATSAAVIATVLAVVAWRVRKRNQMLNALASSRGMRGKRYAGDVESDPLMPR